MRLSLHSLAAASSIPMLAAMLLVPAAGAAAQQPQSAPAAVPDAPAFQQAPLTDKQIEGLLASQKEVEEASAKINEDADKPDPKVAAQLDAITRKHGFADYADYDKVAGNIGIVMSGFDPETKKYVGPDNVLKKQLAQVKADTQIPPLDKKKAISDIEAAIKQVTPVKYPDNIPLVSKYYDKLSEALQGD